MCNLCADSTFPFQTVRDSELDKLFSFDLDFPNLNPTYLNDVFKNADDNGRRVARIWKRGGGYFERVRSVQTTLTGIFIDLEAVSDGLSEN